MSIVIGDAVIIVGADASKFTSDLSSQTSKSTPGIGSKITSILGKTLKAGAVTVGTAVGGTLGLALFKGFQRLDAIDQAKAKLSGLGHSAGSVQKIMDNALASVKGTAFGMGEAASSAATLVAAGIKPGKDLTRTLSLMGDAATIAGTDLGDMASIFNKAAAGGKITGDTIAQLTDRGIPILQLLAKQYGVTAAEAQKMVSDGKVDFATFQNAIEDGMGGAALKSGQTFSGALKNVQAALGRLGAGLLSGVFSKLPEVFAGAISWIDKMGPAATKAGEVIGNAFGKVISYISSIKLPDIDFGKIAAGIKKAFNSDLIQNFLDSVGGLFGSLKSAAATLIPALLKIAKALAPIVGAAVVAGIAALTVAFKVAGPIIEGLASAFSGLVDIVSNSGVQAALAGIAAILAVMFLPAIAQTLTLTAALIAWTVAGKVQSAVTKGMAAAQWLLNAAMSANPIGIIVALLAGLVVAIVVLWKKNEGFRNAVISVWNAIKSAFSSVVNWFTGTLVPMFVGAFEAIKGAVMTAVNFIKDHWQLIISIFLGPLGVVIALVTSNFETIKAVIGTVINAIWTVITTVWNAILTTITTVVSAIKTAVTIYFNAYKAVITTILNAIKAVVSSIWNGIKAVISGVVNAIKAVVTSVFNAIKGVITKVWNSVKSTTTSIWNGIKSGVSSAINSVKSTVTNGLNNVWNSIKGLPGKVLGLAGSFLNAGKTIGGKIVSGMAQGLRNIINGIGDFGALVKSKINAALGLPKKIHGPGPIPDFTIPGFYKGVRNFKGGLAMVGEKGAELVNLPGGSDVYSNSKSRKMLGNGSTTQTYGDIYVTISVDDLDKMNKVGDFLKALDTARVTSRKTLRSGTVTA